MSALTTAAAKSASKSAAPKRVNKIKPLPPAAIADLLEVRRRWNEVLDLVNDLISDLEEGNVGEHLSEDQYRETKGYLNEVWSTLANEGPRVRRYQA